MCFQQLHKCSDDKWVCATVTQLAQFKRLCEGVLGKPELLTKSLTSRWPGASPADATALIEAVAVEIAQHPQRHWLDLMIANNVPCAPVATYRDVGDETHTVGRHLYANNYMVKGSHRDYGEKGQLKWPGVPAAFSDTPSPVPGPDESWHAPYIGEHTDQILAEIGYSDEEAAELVESGAVPKPVGAYAEEASREARASYAANLAKKNAAAVAEAAEIKSRL